MPDEIVQQATELTELPNIQGSDLVAYSDEDIAAVAKAGDYLPRIQVIGSNSDLMKENKLPLGTFALVTTKDQYVDLGKEFDFLAISVRPKAMRLVPTVMSYFDRNSDEFKKIKIDSNGQDSGCMWGAEFLCWIPSQRQFASFFFGSKSARRESPNLLTIMKSDGDYKMTMATARVKFVPKSQTNKYSWYVQEVIPCSTKASILPDAEALADELKTFNNPPKNKVEKAEPLNTGRER